MFENSEKQLKWTGFFSEEHQIVARLHQNHPKYPAHDHEFVEVMFVVSGSCLHETELGRSWIYPGSGYLFRPGAWHGFSDTRDLVIYNCCFSSLILGWELGWMIGDPQLGRLLWGIPLSPEQYGLVSLTLSETGMRSCVRLLKELWDLTLDPHSFPRMQALCRLMMLLEIMAGHLPPQSQSKDGHRNTSISSVLKLIDARPEYDWTLEARAGAKTLPSR